jgi:hypothetical protein
MEDKNIKFLDKVVEFLIRDTKIEYNTQSIKCPFDSSYFAFNLFPSHNSYDTVSCWYNPSKGFINYCQNTYGLTDEEIKYVWVKYRNIIMDKIEHFIG